MLVSAVQQVVTFKYIEIYVVHQYMLRIFLKNFLLYFKEDGSSLTALDYDTGLS